MKKIFIILFSVLILAGLSLAFLKLPKLFLGNRVGQPKPAAPNQSKEPDLLADWPEIGSREYKEYLENLPLEFREMTVEEKAGFNISRDIRAEIKKGQGIPIININLESATSALPLGSDE